MLTGYFAGALLIAGQHIVTKSSGDPHLELWQVINLVGAPLLAVLFAQPVVEDLTAWFRSTRTQ